jgi:hypothetical protein
MRLPEHIEVTVKAGGEPLEGLLIQLSILTTFKNNFVLLFGPTGVDGKLIINRDEMITQALRDQELFMMDFGDPEIHFSGELLVSVFGKEAIARAINVYPDFKDVYEFPTGHLDQLHRAFQILANLGDQEISVDVVNEEAGNVLIRVKSDS